MIAFKYTKTDGAEYLSHLDLLRHIDRTLKRAGMTVKTSEGFNPHPKIFMNNPLGLGIKSVAEFCAADTVYEGDFAAAFNRFSPKGIKCLGFKEVDKNPNYACSIDKCGYLASGIERFDAADILGRTSMTVTDLRGRSVDILPRIHCLEWRGEQLYFVLGCGQNNLRPDLFCNILEKEYGGSTTEIVKIASFGEYTF